MLFSSNFFIQVAIFILGAAGFLVARHVRNHKVKDTPLVCMVGFDCQAVVHSDYSKFLGLPVETLGMVYYAFVSLFYLFFLVTQSAIPAALNQIMGLASLAALMFSLYLIAIQIFVLRKGCSWCFVSAFISIFIFTLTALNYDFSSLVQLFTK